MNKLYKELVSLCKEGGICVFHYKFDNKGENLGFYLPESRRIHIRKSLKETLDGIYVLAHEMGHAIDHSQGKHSVFFDFNNKIVFSEKNWQIIKRAEISASRRGIRILNKMGFDISLDNLTGSILDIVVDQKSNEKYFNKWKKGYFFV